MRFFISLLIIIVGTYILQLYLPWYTIAILPLVTGLLFPKKAAPAFFAGFLGIGILWALLAYLIHYQTDAILTGKVAQILMVNKGIFVILATALVGGLVGGFWGLGGFYLRRMFIAPRKKSNRYEFS